MRSGTGAVVDFGEIAIDVNSREPRPPNLSINRDWTRLEPCSSRLLSGYLFAAAEKAWRIGVVSLTVTGNRGVP
jgi:hypothetical protein